MANMSFGVNLLPKTNNTYSLGNSDYKWNIFINTINGTALSNIVLPTVTSANNGQILQVDNGAWTLGDAKLDKNYNYGKFTQKTWEGLTEFEGRYIWSDGDNIYYSKNDKQYILDKSTLTWSSKIWSGLSNFNGDCIWSDGDNIYYSVGPEQYILNKSTSTWSAKSWSGLTYLIGVYIWSDSDNIYYSNNSEQYKLNKSTSTWIQTTWNINNFYGLYVWYDNDNIYYSSGDYQYIYNKSSSNWSRKTWYGLSNFYGPGVWSDGENVYYSAGSSQYILDKSTSTWTVKTWTGLTNFTSDGIWSDGNNIYYSNQGDQFVMPSSSSKIYIGKNGIFKMISIGTANGVASLDSNGKIPINQLPDIKELPNITTEDNNKSLDVIDGIWATGKVKLDKHYMPGTFIEKTWNGLEYFSGECIWSDGNNTYYSYSDDQYILDRTISTWSTKTWNGLEYFYGDYIWSDGDNIYYSYSNNQYVLDKTTSTWLVKTWSGLEYFSGYYIWSDGNNIYYSDDSEQYILDKSTSTWVTKEWSGLTSFSGYYVWSDNDNIYYSDEYEQYVLDKLTSTWSVKEWIGIEQFYGNSVWFHENNIYYSYGDDNQYVLDKSTSTWSIKEWPEINNFYGYDIWYDKDNVYYNSDNKQYILLSNSPKVYIGNDGTFEMTSIGTANGVASLDSTGKIPISQLPEIDNGLPSVTSTDNGKFLGVDNGVWVAVTAPTTDISGLAPKASPIFTGSISLGRKENTTVGSNSYAVGTTVEASADNAHAEGNSTRAAYVDSHAEGWGSEAISQAAHAEGRQGRATAFSAHAEGCQTTASGYASHSQGMGTQAKNKSQHVAGEYNVVDPSTNAAGVRGEYAEIIGNGTDNSNRSNARVLDWNGNEKLAGDLYVGCDEDSTGGSKVATEIYVSTAISGIILPTKVSDLTNDSGFLTSVPTMTGATSSANGTAGLIPAPTSADAEKFFRGDGTWQDGGRPMVILSYGSSTWNDFITAYKNNVIVYCRASSNSNPATGSQTRMAFMAYVNNATKPTEVEFQYYRSMSSHSATAMGDEVYVYKLTSAGAWSVTVRKASIKEIAVASGSKLGVSWSSDKVTLSNTMTANDMPMSSSDTTTTKAAIDTLSRNINTTYRDIYGSGSINDCNNAEIGKWYHIYPSASNVPIQSTGILFTYGNSGDMHQICESASRYFVRRYNGSAWTNWEELALNSNLAKIDDNTVAFWSTLSTIKYQGKYFAQVYGNFKGKTLTLTGATVYNGTASYNILSTSEATKLNDFCVNIVTASDSVGGTPLYVAFSVS